MLAVYAWPPTSNERRLPPAERPRYPHPFLWPPLIIGVLASITMQALRDPVLEAISMLPEQLGRMFSRSGFTASRSKSTIRLLLLAALGIFLHTAMQELLRVIALYLCEPHSSTMVTTTRLFQQSYYLGIGWGAAEAFWGITRGWFSGVRLWSDLLDKVSVEPVADPERNMSTSTAQDYATATSQQMESEVVVADDQSSVSSLEDEEDNLLAKIEALQRLRGRKDLEDALGKPFPNIAVAVHILWRLDTILLNLGFTLIVSAFYYNTEPIYHRLSARSSLPSGKYGLTPLDELKPHRLFPLVVAGVALAHFVISWVWAVGVRRVGLSAVTWGSLVVSLAAFFAGLGSWGGLV
ncbi:hypothetical protein FFLO_00150 [Filobasidium floriforme]|uniref:Uncharacterized protein n=1 Tax=Filobasidium floriforme TaxID=5210 RepID=A0A8K0NTS2_9TREE|nr:uncharacterized protein HD553DRAFT_194672 [Filobasidium floriforme]KAG7579942.1 hypothetical protein FFLO_00150 [Filobasidium floriforme]KAH8087338.1 hypothetical protein HD553DRAFT_194672 [Filobasidium floriforme]